MAMTDSSNSEASRGRRIAQLENEVAQLRNVGTVVGVVGVASAIATGGFSIPISGVIGAGTAVVASGLLGKKMSSERELKKEKGLLADK